MKNKRKDFSDLQLTLFETERVSSSNDSFITAEGIALPKTASPSEK